MDNLIDNFIEFMESVGIEPARTSDIKADGKRGRYQVAGDKPKSKNGSYSLTIENDGFAYGYCMTFKDGIVHGWHNKTDNKYTAEERAEYKKRIEARRKENEAERIKRRERGKKTAQELWAGANKVTSHAYIDKKQIKPVGIRQVNDTLILPMYKGGEIVNAQKIYQNGFKEFTKGAEVKGAYLPILKKGDNLDTIIICEGYATGATLYEAMGNPVVVAFNAGNLKAVALAFAEKYPKSELIIASDNDAWTEVNGKPYNTGLVKAREACEATGALLASFENKGLKKGTTDYNDLAILKGISYIKDKWRVEVCLSEVICKSNASPPAFDAPPAHIYENDFDWRENLIVNKDGKLISSSLENASLFTLHHDDMRGVFAYNEFAGETYVVKCPPWEDKAKFKAREVSNYDLASLQRWLEHRGLRVSKEKAIDAIEYSAQKQSINPAIEHFNNMVWDGQNRLDKWLSYYLGAEEENADYLSFIGKKWLMAAVKRTYEAGCKFDHMLVIEGEQGIGKSTMLETLATFGEGEDKEVYFIDDLNAESISNKDTVAKLRGCLIVEMSEMAGFSKKDDQAMKSWITTKRDKVRTPYAKKPIIIPRQFVIAGTTNDYEYLKDPSGNRRYWCFKAGNIDLKALKKDREQLWAEAVHRYKAGETIAPSKEEQALAMAEQKKRIHIDEWQYIIEDIIPSLGSNGFLAKDILIEMGRKKADIKFADQRRVGNVLRMLGYENKTVRVGTRSLKKWVSNDG